MCIRDSIRTSRNVALTDAGHRLLDNAGPAIEQALDALKHVKAQPGEVTGRVRLTVPSAAVTLILAELIPRFRAKYPKVEVEAHVDDRLVNLVAGKFDAGIRLIEAIDRDMVHVRLTPPTRVVVVGAPSYLEKRGVPLKPKDLLHHDCVCIRRGTTGDPWAWELERGKKSWRVPVRGPVTTNDPELMRAMAVAGVGLLYALEDRVKDELATGSSASCSSNTPRKFPGSTCTSRAARRSLQR